MKHNIPINILPYVAGVVIISRRFVSIATEGVTHANTHMPIVGVSGRFDVGVGQTVDIVTAGFMPVEYGASIKRGVLVDSNADGKAVPSATGRFVALEDGDVGSIGSVIAALSQPINQSAA
ncbi:hypothetical protein DTO96_102160 [Ephemeroptericola cinctiostellae]|uniref:DUF2190 domain-containing protein n=1 Tax=Ephemeroptericola cinctiostellae TaxID=2268024 RepID=A0A345DDG8_9BURK|nr:DUF2190 family protein [Ephemeroptericola cinctiostellae]AXF86406.1 hypothetical protein DTO96_102160 [Ephemeroptericola cinctiostellae]